MKRLPLAVAVLALTGAVAPAGAVSGVSPQASPTWGTGAGQAKKAGRVLAVVEAGPLAYLAGEFTAMVPPGGDRAASVPRRYLAALEVGSGALSSWDLALDGPVRALALSPDGRRLYVGGAFARIGGQPVRNLAAVDPSTGALDPTFRPPWLDSGVRALAVHGGRLYVGGNFTQTRTPDGALTHRPQLAALDAGSGALLDWLPPDNEGGEFFGQTGEKSSSGDGLVYDLAVSADGDLVHVAGTFLDFGGRSGLLTLEAATGRPTAWQGDMDRPVFGLAVSPTDGHTLYTATGGAGGRLYAFNPEGDPEPTLEVKTDGDAVDVLVSSATVYLLGHYDFIVSSKSDCFRHCPGGPERHHLAAFDARTGEIDPWAPAANTPTGPYSGAIGTEHLWVGGDFTMINRQPHPGIAQFPGVP